MGQLVDAVELEALLAVHLDVDVQPLHQRRGVGTLEGFVRHDVAPMTGRVTDGEQDRLVEIDGLGERLVIPRLPMMEADAWLILPARERAGNPAQARDNELTRNLAQIFAYRGRGEAAHAHATADAKRGPAPDAESDASQDPGITSADAAYRGYLDAEVAAISKQIADRVRRRFE